MLTEVDTILQDIRFTNSNFKGLIWSDVKRDVNNVAHNLAKL